MYKTQFILGLDLDSLKISPLTKPLINIDSWQYVPSMPLPIFIDFVCNVMSLMGFSTWGKKPQQVWSVCVLRCRQIGWSWLYLMSTSVYTILLYLYQQPLHFSLSCQLPSVLLHILARAAVSLKESVITCSNGAAAILERVFTTMGYFSCSWISLFPFIINLKLEHFPKL